MKVLVILVVVYAAIVESKTRTKRQAYQLPDGAELLVGSIRTTFTCSGNGYYADTENNCQVFHVCNTNVHEDGRQETQHYSFLCGNLTVFDQLTLTCTYPEDAVPCASARDFYYVNQNIGDPAAYFLSDNDIERARPLKASYAGGAPGGPAAGRPATRPGRPFQRSNIN